MRKKIKWKKYFLSSRKLLLLGLVVLFWVGFGVGSQNASAVDRVSKTSITVDSTTINQNTTTNFNSWRLNTLIINLEQGEYYSNYDRTTIDFAIAFSTTSTSTLSECSLLRPYATVYRIIDQKIESSDLDGWHICSYSIDVDISEVVGDLTRFYFYQNLFVTQNFSSNISSPNVSIYVRLIGGVSITYWNSEAKGIIGAIQGTLEDTANEIEQQNQTYQQETTDYSIAETNNNTDINQGQSSLNQGGTTLIGIVQGFKTNVLDQINTNTTDCNMNLGNPYGFNMGNINLCTYSPPTWLSSLVNIMASLALVALAIHVFWRIINVIKGFAK